jgi:hypothetical protein
MKSLKHSEVSPTVSWTNMQNIKQQRYCLNRNVYTYRHKVKQLNVHPHIK